jgi:riboflavin synthase
MFSGIIEEIGEIRSITRRGNIAVLEVKANKVILDAKVGDSISVNGACLTIVKVSKDSLSFEAIQETLRLTNLGALKIADKVNLERSLKVGDRVSGHFVTGHVDCQGVIRRKSHKAGNLCFEIAVPPELFAYIILPKGSVAVDGISLTIAEKKQGCLAVYIIPHTLANTTLSFKGPSDKVNLEFDILAKRAALNSHLQA